MQKFLEFQTHQANEAHKKCQLFSKRDSRSLRREVIKMIKANPKANRASSFMPTLVLTNDNKTSAQDVDTNFTMEMKDVQQAMQNVTFATKQDTSVICATNIINNSNKHL